MPKTIITTVGTSLITNWLKDNTVSDELKNKVEGLKNKPFYQDGSIIERRLKKYAKSAASIKKHLVEYVNDKGAKATAETSSSSEIKKEFSNDTVSIYLICTDTILSPLCAEVIKDWMQSNDFEVIFDNIQNIVDKINEKDFESKYIIRDLRVDDKEKFEKRGLINLIDSFKKIIDRYYKDFCLLNITGGYKGVIPFLTIFSQISRVKIFYLFEETAHSINIPQLDIDIDWDFYIENRSTFSLLKEGYFLEANEDWDTYKEVNNIPDEFDNYHQIYKDGDDKLLELNAIGYLLVQEYDRYVFVNIPVNFRYFKDNGKIRKEAKRAIKLLYNKLTALEVNFDTLTDKFLKHCPVADTTVFKETNVHLRIQYQYNQKKKELTVFNYYYKSETGDEYAKYFSNEYDIYKNVRKIHLAIEK